MAKSKVFFYFCLAFIAGISLNSSFTSIPQLLMLGFLIFGILLISVFWRNKKLVVIGFSVLFLVLGIWKHQQIEFSTDNNQLRKLNDKEETITLIGVISKEPDIREYNQKLVVNIEELKGKILLTVKKYQDHQYGDELKITGILKTPPEFEDFNYKDYLLKDGIYSVMDYPAIELIGKDQGNLILALILQFKNRLREVIYRNLSPPQGPILAALLLGDKRQISSAWNEKLNASGVRHITAVSGMHVAILTSILMSFLLGLGLWRQQAFYFSLILIVFFIILTGLQSSAVRAGIMGGGFLISQYLGRMNNSSRTLVFAAALMSFQNPLLLKLDVGFQLSFLAMAGIIYLTPFFQDLFRKLPDRFSFRNILSMTVAAQIFTLPILLYDFGYFSLIAPLTNILILPVLSYIMGLGFVFVLGGTVFQPLTLLFSWPVLFFLTYLTKIVDYLSGFSWASQSFKISSFWLMVSYLVLGLVTWRLNSKQRLKFLKF